MVALAGAAFVAIFFFAVPFPVIVFGAALVGFAGGRLGIPAFRGSGETSGGDPPAGLVDDLLGDEAPAHARASLAQALKVIAVWGALWLAPVAALLLMFGMRNVFSQIAVFFSAMAMVTFGGAYAALAYVAQQAVEHYGWLRPGEMLDGLGMAETTPGPLIMVLQFVGFMAAFRDAGALSPLAAGVLGGLLGPCFPWDSPGAPFIEKLRGNKTLPAALTAVTAAIVGIILNLAVWFALHSIFREVVAVRGFGLHFDAPVLASVDPKALALAAAAVLAVFVFRLGTGWTLAGAAAAGAAIHLVERAF